LAAIAAKSFSAIRQSSGYSARASFFGKELFMSTFLRDFTSACSGSHYSAVGVPLLKYVTTGEDKWLAQAQQQAKKMYGMYFLGGVWLQLSPPGELWPVPRSDAERAWFAGTCPGGRFHDRGP
jgi:hypothetical protein